MRFHLGIRIQIAVSALGGSINAHLTRLPNTIHGSAGK